MTVGKGKAKRVVEIEQSAAVEIRFYRRSGVDKHCGSFLQRVDRGRRWGKAVPARQKPAKQKPKQKPAKQKPAKPELQEQELEDQEPEPWVGTKKAKARRRKRASMQRH